MKFWKIIKGGTLRVGRGSNPWENGRPHPPPPPRAPPPLNLPLLDLIIFGSLASESRNPTTACQWGFLWNFFHFHVRLHSILTVEWMLFIEHLQDCPLAALSVVVIFCICESITYNTKLCARLSNSHFGLLMSDFATYVTNHLKTVNTYQ